MVASRGSTLECLAHKRLNRYVKITPDYFTEIILVNGIYPMYFSEQKS